MSLFRRYGKSILIIDSDSHRVVKVFKVSEIRQSLEFCENGRYIHQYCKETICGVTEVITSIISVP